MYCRICGVAEVYNRKSVYRTALLGVENAQGTEVTVELNVEWSR
jgi:predicted nucleic-acid-binding Zn-ribbon protein